VRGVVGDEVSERNLVGKFMRRLFILVAALTSLASVPARAATDVLDFQMGVSTVEQVSSSLAKKTKVSETGTNSVSGGRMLWTDGASYNMEGLSEVIYIFDAQKKLMGVVMTMKKGQYTQMQQWLASQFKLKSDKPEFEGDQFARFATQDTIIELDAPRLSPRMELRFLRNDLVEKLRTQSGKKSS
jgi:hypothetical protein